jgi:hypothetical protein
VPLPRGRYGLRLHFRNGRRNVHLQGAKVEGRCDLGLELGFGPSGLRIVEGGAQRKGAVAGLRIADGEADGAKTSAGLRIAETGVAGRGGPEGAAGDALGAQRWRVCALLCEAVPGTALEEAWHQLTTANRWNADAAAATLMDGRL